MIAALAIFSIGVTGTLAVFAASLRATATSAGHTRAIFLAQGLVEEVLAADVGTGRAYSFPGIAGEIWMALVAGGSPESVVDRLATEYDVEPARLRTDVDSLVERAVGLGLLRRVDDA